MGSETHTQTAVLAWATAVSLFDPRGGIHFSIPIRPYLISISALTAGRKRRAERGDPQWWVAAPGRGGECRRRRGVPARLAQAVPVRGGLAARKRESEEERSSEDRWGIQRNRREIEREKEAFF